MPKLETIKAARASKKQRRCCRCSHVIEVGEPYKRADFKTGPYSSMTRVWCKDHNPRPSEMTINDRLSTLYSVQEGLEDDIASFNAGNMDFEDLAAALETAAGEVEGVRDEYQESHDNMPENLQYSQQAEELEEKAQSCDTWADALNNAASEVRDKIPDNPDACNECDEEEDASCHQETFGNGAENPDFDHEFEPLDVEAARSEAAGIAEAAAGELDL